MKVALKTITAVLLGILAIYLLWQSTSMPNKRSNGFKRTFLTYNLDEVKKIKLPIMGKHIIKLSDTSVLLSTDSLNRILAYNFRKGTGQIHVLQLPLDVRRINRRSYLYEFVPYDSTLALYINNLSCRVIFNSISASPQKIERVAEQPFFYATTLSKDAFVIRQYNKVKSDAIFELVNIRKQTTKSEHRISLKSLDGGLSTDGQLLYNSSLKKIFYMHYYFNTILSFDSTMKAALSFHTIDTVSYKPHIDTSKPLMVTNKKASIFKHYVFVCSNLKADNEVNATYRQNIPIDIYDARNGQYTGSFYLPISNGKLIKSFLYNGKTLSALYYDNSIHVFSLHLHGIKN